MIYSIQPKIYSKLKGPLYGYGVISLVLISFIFFTIKYNQTSSQKREDAINKIIKNNFFLELNKFVLQKVTSPYTNISHQVKKGESLSKVFKIYNINQQDIAKANNELKKFIKPNNLKTGVILDLSIKKNIWQS